MQRHRRRQEKALQVESSQGFELPQSVSVGVSLPEGASNLVVNAESTFNTSLKFTQNTIFADLLSVGIGSKSG